MKFKRSPVKLPKSIKKLESINLRNNLASVLSHVTQNLGSDDDVKNFVELKANASYALEQTKGWVITVNKNTTCSYKNNL